MCNSIPQTNSAEYGWEKHIEIGYLRIKNMALVGGQNFIRPSPNFRLSLYIISLICVMMVLQPHHIPHRLQTENTPQKSQAPHNECKLPRMTGTDVSRSETDIGCF